MVQRTERTYDQILESRLWPQIWPSPCAERERSASRSERSGLGSSRNLKQPRVDHLTQTITAYTTVKIFLRNQLLLKCPSLPAHDDVLRNSLPAKLDLPPGSFLNCRAERTPSKSLCRT